MGKDQEKGAVFLHGPSLRLLGTKTSVNATENSLCPIPQGVLEWVAGGGGGARGSFYIGLGPWWLPVSAQALLKFT